MYSIDGIDGIYRIYGIHGIYGIDTDIHGTIQGRKKRRRPPFGAAAAVAWASADRGLSSITGKDEVEVAARLENLAWNMAC
jgi:hypothetical protein